jgi:prophage tail gpP-like protein
MSEFLPSRAEREEVTLVLSDSGLEVTEFTEYQFNSNFLTPVDGFSLSIGAEKLSDAMKEALKPGAAVKLTVNGHVQSSGYIDSIEISASRSSGTVYRIEGRDRLGQVADACADPTKSFKQGQTLEDALISLFAPFGWSKPEQFLTDAAADRDVKMGQLRGTPMTRGGKKKGPRPTRDFVLHQLRPRAPEGVLEFAMRIAERFGLTIWLSADGEQVLIAKPEFDQPPRYTIIRNAHGDTNVLEGSVKFDISEQPTVIIADGFAGGGEFGKSRIRAIYANVAVSAGDEAVAPELQPYINAGAKVLGGHTFPAESVITVPRHRVQFLQDNDSQTQEQLENFMRRKMAVLQRRSLQVSYTVEGHGQITPNGFMPWTVDSTVRIEDDIAGLHETLYVLGRTFVKSRSGGTTTRLELIRLNSLTF